MFLFSGCAKPTTTVKTLPPAPVAPTTTVETLPARPGQAKLAVGAEPYYSKRQKTVFGQDLSQKGILPVHVHLENRGTQPLTVRPTTMSLKLPDASVVTTTGPPTREQPAAAKAGRYVAAGALFGAMGVAAAVAQDKGQARLYGKYTKEQLQEVTLTKGESVHGFVYFHMPQGIQHATGAHLIVPYLPAKGGGGEVRVPLGGM
jgi:hypothetical protein